MKFRAPPSSISNHPKHGVLSLVITSLFMLMFIYGPPAWAAAQKRAAIVIASENYSVVQFKALEKVFHDNRIQFNVVSTKAGEAKSGNHVLMVDLLIEELDVERFDAVIFVGGFGALDDLIDNEKALNLSRQAAKRGKVVGGS